MKTAIVLLTTLLQPLVASTLAPDLCADVLLNTSGVPVTDADGTTLARFCEWTGPSAPMWRGDVCCKINEQGAACSATNNGVCDSGMKLYCEYGETIPGAGFVCYQPLPSACEYSGCGGGDAVQAADNTQEDLLCCEDGDCWEWTSLYLEDCLGFFSWCTSGYLNADGTVDCYD